MLGLLRFEGLSYFMTGTRDLASTTPNYCVDKGVRVHNSPPNLGDVLSEVGVKNLPNEGLSQTCQMDPAVWPGGTNNSKRLIHRCKECGPLVYRSELQHMEAEMGSSE